MIDGFHSPSERPMANIHHIGLILNCWSLSDCLELSAVPVYKPESNQMKQVKNLGSSLARQNGDEEAIVVQQLSVSLMRGNAALFNNRCPPDSDNRDDDVRW